MPMPKGENLRGIGGAKKFGRDTDPTKGGKKKSLLNVTWSIILPDSEISERIIEIPKADKLKIIEKLLECNKEQLKAIGKQPSTPIFILLIINAIIGDIESKTLKNAKELFDRTMGTATQTHEHTGKNGGAIDVSNSHKLDELSDEALSKLYELQQIVQKKV